MSIPRYPSPFFIKKNNGKITKAMNKGNACYTWTLDIEIPFKDYQFDICRHDNRHSPHFKTEINDGVWYFSLKSVHQSVLEDDINDFNASLHLHNMFREDSSLYREIKLSIKINVNNDCLLETNNILKSSLTDVKSKTKDEHKYFLFEIDSVIKGKVIVTCELLNSIENKISRDLKLFQQSEELYDLTIIVEKNKLRVHKAILASRSPVFLKMFASDMRQKYENKIEINDISYEIMNKVISYIYTSEVENLEGNESEVLHAAEKYCLEGLKIICGQLLFNSLTLNNAIERLILSDQFNIDYLKEAALILITERIREVQAMKEFRNLHNSHPHLKTQILAFLSRR